MKRQEFLQRALPFLKMAAIAAGAAAVVVTVGLLTAPVIMNGRAREEAAFVRDAADGLEPGRRYVAFPLSLKRARFAELILSRCPGEAERQAVRGYYEAGPDETVVLKPNLSVSDHQSLSRLLESIGYENEGAVRAYRPVMSSGSPAGYVLELEGSGFNGALRLLTFVSSDGTIRKTTLEEPAGNGIRRMSDNDSRLLGFFMGTKGPGVPTAAGMLPKPQADAVSGATVTFSGMGTALREGSLFVTRIGGGS